VNFLDDYERQKRELIVKKAQVLEKYEAFKKKQQGKLVEVRKRFADDTAKLEQQFFNGEITEANYRRQRQYLEQGLQKIENTSSLLK